MKLRKLTALMAVGVLALSLAACGSSSDASSESEESTSTESEAEETEEEDTEEADTEEEEAADDTEAAAGDITVGVVSKAEHPYYTEMAQGAEDACAELGWTCIYEAPQSFDDVDGQVSMVEDLITKGVDVLMVAPNQESTLYNAFDEAVDQGTMILGVDTDITGYENKTAFVGTNNKEALKTAGTELAALLDEGSNVIILRGPLGDANHEARAEGATEGLEEAGMNVLEVKDANSTAETAAAAMEDFMTKYPDQIDAVLCCDDDMAAGAIQAIRQAGMEDKIIVSGFDGTDVGIQNVADGYEVFDLSQNPYQMGYQAVYTAYAAMNGEDYEETVDTGVQMITIDNYKDFQ